MHHLLRHRGINDASGSVITGFKVNGNIQGTGLLTNNIRIFRNQVAYIILLASSANWVIYNNIIGGYVSAATVTNLFIQNNIFAGSYLVNCNLPSVFIDHNLFIHNGINALSADSYAVVTNNIFVTPSAAPVMAANVNYNTITNNLSLTTNISPTAPTNSFLTGPNSGGANQVGVDPLFVNVPSFTAYNATYNYRLQAGSTGHNASTDGTDLGIYGGTYPFPSGGIPGSGFDTSAPAGIPQVTVVNILNGSVQPGGTLNVNAKAKVNN